MNRKRVLVVAWSGAEWSAIHPALDRGELPHLQALVEKGSSGPLTTFAPLSLPIIATTLATGFFAARHGVLDDVEHRPDGGGVQPIGRRSWREPALWQTLAANGLKPVVVNWPATTPATLWPGIVVDERFAMPEGRSFEEWPLPLDCVAPDALRAMMTDLRVHPAEIGAAELSALLPSLDGIDTKRDRRPARLLVSLARTASIHAAATHLAETADWDLLLLRHCLLTDLWRDLAAHAGEQEDGRYDGAISRAYRLLDVMLGRLLELAGPDTTVFVVAAAGWRTAGVAVRDSDDEATAAYDKGMLVACGPGIKSDAIFHRATVADLAPTVLACFGLSAPGDGGILESLFAQGTPPTKATAPAIAAPPTPACDPAAHLLALGYSDMLSEAQSKAMADANLAALRNLAESHVSRQEWPQAIAIFQAILQHAPGDLITHLKLGRTLLLLGDVEGARTQAQAALSAAPDSPLADLLMGSVHAMAGDAAAAEPHIQRARALGGQTPSMDLRLGWVALILRRWGEAEASFRAVIGANDSIAEAHTGLGVSLEGQQRMKEAETALRRAIALAYDNALAHFHLGRVLAARGAQDEAMAALRVALAQNPGLAEAKDLLMRMEAATAP